VPLTSFAPDIFGAAILGPLRDTLVFGAPDVVTRDERVALSQAKRWEFKVDDVDTAESVLPLVASEVAHALAHEVDQFLASHYMETANLTTGTEIAASRPTDVIDRCLRPLSSALDAAGVWPAGRYVIVPPAVYFILRQDSRFVGTFGPNGLVGGATGFRVRMSNHCAEPSTGTFVVQAGVPDAITFAERIDEVEVQRSPVSPDVVHGVARYGCHVAKPEALACCLVALH
jgi:hypothetical protein